MKKIFAMLIIFTSFSSASNSDMEMIDGEKLQVVPERFDGFIENLKNSQVVIVNVKGMVCDFCARGIEKIFKKDINVKKIDVDLSKGQVLIAYPLEGEVDFDDIKQKFLVNGLNATDMKIINI